jgi:sugar phosphate isomerase/epimerase
MTMTMVQAVTRREFLHLSSGTLAGFMLGRQGFSDDKKGQGDEFGGFTVAVQSYTFRQFDTEQALKRIRDAGIAYAEFYSKHIDPKSTSGQRAAFRRLCEEYGIKPVAFGVQHFTKDHDANRLYFEFAKNLGLQALSADPDPDSFDSLDKLCEEYRVAIAIHPHGPTGGGKLHRWYGSEVILPAIKNHHPLIGTCLDTGHLIRCAQVGKRLDPAAEVRAMGPRNFGMHLKDHDNQRRRDVPFGDGSLDVAAVLKALRDVRFKGYIAIEYEANPDNPSVDVAECVKRFKEAVRQLT